MRRPTRIASFIITVILMVTFTVVAVGADKTTSFDDIKGYVTEMEYEKN